MNKKGKNKKGKVSNPSPSQEVKQSETVDLGVINDESISGIPGEIVGNVAETIGSVKEERVPEIISEIILPSVATKDEETPKKPKRNRGKKKKGNENEFEDILDLETTESVKESNVEKKEDILEIERLDAPIIAPTTRKKKTKKKNIDQTPKQVVQSDLDQTKPLVSASEITKEPDIKEIVQETNMSTESNDQEVKPSKKKNKKKKRNDSEKSEKEDVSCTAAFQKLIEVKDEFLELKTEQIVEDNAVLAESITPDIESVSEKGTLVKEIIAETKQYQDEVISTKGKDSQQLPVAEEKGKKKNKKDKKHILEKGKNISISNEGIAVGPFLAADNIANEEFPKDILEIENYKCVTEEPKLKAIIVKPVEKKRKEHQDTQSTKEPVEPVISETDVLKVTEKEIRNELETINIQPDCQREPINVTIPETVPDPGKELSSEHCEPLNINDKPTSKKRKKQPKLPRTPDVSYEDLEHKEEIYINQPDFDSADKNLAMLTETTELIQEESAKDETSEAPMKLDSQMQSELTIELIPQNSSKEIRHELETINIQPDCQRERINVNIPETVPDPAKELSLEHFEPLNINDKPTSKRRKKQPKLPRTPDVSFEDLEPKEEIYINQLDFDNADKNLAMLTETTELIQEESAKDETSKAPMKLDSQMQSKLTIELIPQNSSKEHILLTPEYLEKPEVSKIETLTSEKNETSPKVEVKATKKSKKAPKLNKKVEEQANITEPIVLPTEVISTVPEKTKDIEDKIDTSNITKMYDIEISSIQADEPENLLCETIPDVTYPRAFSQQLMDDNNNNNSIVITEILSPQEIILDTQKEESIDSPKANVTVKSKEITSPSKEEKTDLKSKMMEVNQDMEELRLSIERSLAELTAIEKCEETSEKPHEEGKLTTEGNLSKASHTDIMFIKNDHKNKYENVEKTTTKRPTEQLKPTDIDLVDILDSDKKSEVPLLPLDYIVPTTMVDTLQNDLTVITSDTNKCKGVITEKNDNSPIADTAIDSVIKMMADQSPSMFEDKLANKQEEIDIVPALLTEESNIIELEVDKKIMDTKSREQEPGSDVPPVCPSRKDPKSKHKKKKGKQDSQTVSLPTQSTQNMSSQSTSNTQEAKKQEKSDTKSTKKSDSKDTKHKGKQQASTVDPVTEQDQLSDKDFEPIENFEDALTSSVDDVNKSFEVIVNESKGPSNPKVNITAPDEEKTPVSPSKNLLGHPDIPVSSNKRDYKKEKDKIPNEITAKVKIKDAVDVERKQSKNTQTMNKLKDLNDCRLTENEEFVYKYSFRKVFLQNSCHVCKKNLNVCRLACCYCNLVFYCGNKHKDEDWPLHQAFCFAVSTIGHLKDQKHIYADIKNITGHDYRLVRMQMIVSCEKVLKRRLVPWEQEALLYPRICAHVPCREWRQTKLSDCQGCGQISFCTGNQDHYPKSHSRWCKSYSLYEKLVSYQQTNGRLEPRLPTRVMQEPYVIPENINEVLAAMYEEKIDMNDIQYAALTQLATAPLTAAYCYQLCSSKSSTPNGYKKAIFTIHVVGAELQFEADALNKWEVFFLHLRPDLQELRVVLINENLNPSNLPLELLGKIRLCDQCRQDKRRVVLRFQDKRTYADYKTSEDFLVPDIVCSFNPNIQRSSVYNGKDPWPSAIKVILKQKIPFVITGYTITELHKDCIRVKECSEIEPKFISEPKMNSFASVRPDRNFITDDEMPLLFKNYCYAIVCG